MAPGMTADQKQQLFLALRLVWERWFPVGDDDLAFDLGTLLMQMECYPEAMEFFRHSDGLGPSYETALNSALCHFALGEMAEAREAAERALAMSPDSEEAKTLIERCWSAQPSFLHPLFPDIMSLMLRLTALTLAALLPLSAAIKEPVKIDTGQLTGTAGLNPAVRIFEGIPYAAPPTGELRWKAPQPAAKWDGTRAADKFAANCMQRQPNGGAFPPNGGIRPEPGMSEDCLYLNVYTTANSASDKHPVMVWIHGGALTSGAGGIYNGEGLAAKGAVVVTINYRLGAFGYFAHPELTKEAGHGAGNFGFLDQVAALQWVKHNIAAFGGDPSRVTIFGESAGSWSVNYLTASPLAKGLFERAIGETAANSPLPASLPMPKPPAPNSALWPNSAPNRPTN